MKKFAKTGLEHVRRKKDFNFMSYTSALMFQILKEFAGVFIFLIALSRIAQYSYDATGMILFMILIVFDFPLLNPFLSSFMMFAVFFDNSSDAQPKSKLGAGAGTEMEESVNSTKDPGSMNFESTPLITTTDTPVEEVTESSGSTSDVVAETGGVFVYKLVTFIFIAGFQLAAGAAAGYFRIYLDKTYGREVLSTQPLSIAGMPQFVAVNNSIYVYSTPANVNQTVDINTFSPIIQAGTRPWYGPVAYNNIHAESNYATLGKFQTGAVSQSTVMTWYIIEEMFAVLLFLMGVIHILNFTKKIEGLPSPSQAVPAVAIFLLCVLVVAIGNAFPTAHCNAAATIYLHVYEQFINPDTTKQAILIDIQHNETGLRIAGGAIGVIVALIYFYFLPFTGLLGVRGKIDKLKDDNPILKSRFQQAGAKRNMFTYVALKA